MLRTGLTGGVASGKSTIASMLAEEGAFVVDADWLVHEIVAPGGPAFEAVVARFGSAVLDASHRVDREKLGQIVFSDTRARRELEAILHPAVRAEAFRRFERAAREGRSRIGVFDAALLVETGAYREFDRLVVVRCSPETQILRLIERNGLSRSDAETRLAAQAPLEAKLAVADYVIDTEGTLESTRDQTRRLYRRLLADFEKGFA